MKFTQPPLRCPLFHDPPPPSDGVIKSGSPSHNRNFMLDIRLDSLFEHNWSIISRFGTRQSLTIWPNPLSNLIPCILTTKRIACIQRSGCQKVGKGRGSTRRGRREDGLCRAREGRRHAAVGLGPPDGRGAHFAHRQNRRRRSQEDCRRRLPQQSPPPAVRPAEAWCLPVRITMIIIY